LKKKRKEPAKRTNTQTRKRPRIAKLEAAKVLLSLNDESGMQITCQAPIQESGPDDTDITCNNRPSSPRKNAVTQTCITIEHLTYSTENLINSQEMRKSLFLSKVLQSSLHYYTGVSLSVVILKFTYKFMYNLKKNLANILY
jgi:hypothetical protein